MWYKNSYRRHLCDMHIEDWNDKFLSELSPQDYVNNLKKAKLQNAMLYFQSHVGLCHYPTKTGSMHKAFVGKEDTMKQIADLCHKNNISVTGYYSLIYNCREFDKHPDWRMVDAHGIGKRGTATTDEHGRSVISRYGLCCPNNPDYQKFVKAQIQEMAEYFDVDGMFYDMPFWPQNCCCKHCKTRWKNEVGTEFPIKEDWNNPDWLKLMEKRRIWMGEFCKIVMDETKKYHPNVSVEQNFAFAALPGAMPNCAEPVNAACDYAGGDLSGGPYRQSFTCKIYRNITNNQPFEYMFYRCNPNLSRHTVTKSEDEMYSSAMITAAHHGATLVIDAIDPKGTLDSRVYERLGKIFDKEIPYEKYFEGDMIEDVGLYYTMRSKFNAHGEIYTNHEGCVNALDTLIQQNIPCGITGGYHQIDSYKILIAPSLTSEDEYDNDRLINYVKNGGCLYFTGGDAVGLLKEFFGTNVKNRTKESVTYLAPLAQYEDTFDWYNSKYPMHFGTTVPVIEGFDKADVVATLTLPYTARSELKFASIHSDPPGVSTNTPVMLYKNYGKGKVIWSAMPLESVTTYDYRIVFMKLLNKLFQPSYNVIANAPKDVEVVSFQCKDSVLVSCVYLFEGDKAETKDSFTIKVKTGKPKKVVLLPSEESIAFDYIDGYIVFQTRKLNIFDMYKICF